MCLLCFIFLAFFVFDQKKEKTWCATALSRRFFELMVDFKGGGSTDGQPLHNEHCGTSVTRETWLSYGHHKFLANYIPEFVMIWLIFHYMTIIDDLLFFATVLRKSK